MSLVRWHPFREIERLEPFREIDSLQRQINRLFGTLLPTDSSEEIGYPFIPAAELEETPDTLHLKLEVPGLEAKDISVEVMPEQVYITGERKSETKSEDQGITRSEFRYGKFQRVIPLPSPVQNEKVDAEFKDGILRLTLPKAESEKGKAVKVHIG